MCSWILSKPNFEIIFSAKGLLPPNSQNELILSTSYVWTLAKLQRRGCLFGAILLSSKDDMEVHFLSDFFPGALPCWSYRHQVKLIGCYQPLHAFQFQNASRGRSQGGRTGFRRYRSRYCSLLLFLLLLLLLLLLLIIIIIIIISLQSNKGTGVGVIMFTVYIVYALWIATLWTFWQGRLSDDTNRFAAVCSDTVQCVCGRAGAIKVRPSTTGRHKSRTSSSSLSASSSSSHSSSSSSSSSSPWSSLARDEQISGLSQYSLSLSHSLSFLHFLCLSVSVSYLSRPISPVIRLSFLSSVLTNVPRIAFPTTIGV